MSVRSINVAAAVLLGTTVAFLAAALGPALTGSGQGSSPLEQLGPVLGPADADAIIRRRTITPEFDTRAPLREEGRDVSVGGPLTCEAGNQWRIDVDVRQGRARERARTAGMCTGTVQEWRGRVAGAGPGTFKPGSARACGRLVATKQSGAVTQRRRWCRDVTLVSETAAVPSAAAAGADDDDDDDDDGKTLSVVALVLAALALLFGVMTLARARRGT